MPPAEEAIAWTTWGGPGLLLLGLLCLGVGLLYAPLLLVGAPMTIAGPFVLAWRTRVALDVRAGLVRKDWGLLVPLVGRSYPWSREDRLPVVLESNCVFSLTSDGATRWAVTLGGHRLVQTRSFSQAYAQAYRAAKAAGTGVQRDGPEPLLPGEPLGRRLERLRTPPTPKARPASSHVKAVELPDGKAFSFPGARFGETFLVFWFFEALAAGLASFVLFDALQRGKLEVGEAAAGLAVAAIALVWPGLHVKLLRERLELGPAGVTLRRGRLGRPVVFAAPWSALEAAPLGLLCAEGRVAQYGEALEHGEREWLRSLVEAQAHERRDQAPQRLTIPAIRRWPRVAVGFAALGASATLAVSALARHSEPYLASLAALRADPQARQRLGDPIEPGWWVLGWPAVAGHPGFVRYAVHGARASGLVRAMQPAGGPRPVELQVEGYAEIVVVPPPLAEAVP